MSRVKETVEITIPVRIEADDDKAFQWVLREAISDLFVNCVGGDGDHGLWSYRSIASGRRSSVRLPARERTPE